MLGQMLLSFELVTPDNDMVGSVLLAIVTPDNVDVTPAKALSLEVVTPVNDSLSPGGLSGVLFQGDTSLSPFITPVNVLVTPLGSEEALFLPDLVVIVAHSA